MEPVGRIRRRALRLRLDQQTHAAGHHLKRRDPPAVPAAGLIRRRRKAVGSVWRRLNPGQQAMLVPVHLRKGETFRELGAGFGVSAATAWRYVEETVAFLSARSRSSAGCWGRPGGTGCTTWCSTARSSGPTGSGPTGRTTPANIARTA
ncbi:Helix-turn-helix of DDE superfamily endonuclease [Sinosporangium album]|uniref:Helix-turn-helix of DDE superfamily endonuclease n=1 Tax=Sinosporangium album TaxID=504805 RepID=A0A1G8HXH1_9ACTN|nr:Helix-turn-helix of DDE superfamily endonuclease [Sinosporangium album]